MTRVHLPDRRGHELLRLEHNGFQLTVGVGRYASGRVGEIFIDAGEVGTAIDTILRDSAILLSFALQYGASAHEIKRSLSPSGPVAAILGKIEEAPR